MDADTKIYPDSLARMIACMSRDPYIMGLCGETKIANKADSWVTAIQGKFLHDSLLFWYIKNKIILFYSIRVLYLTSFE